MQVLSVEYIHIQPYYRNQITKEESEGSDSNTCMNQTHEKRENSYVNLKQERKENYVQRLKRLHPPLVRMPSVVPQLPSVLWLEGDFCNNGQHGGLHILHLIEYHLIKEVVCVLILTSENQVLFCQIYVVFGFNLKKESVHVTVLI